MPDSNHMTAAAAGPQRGRGVRRAAFFVRKCVNRGDSWLAEPLSERELEILGLLGNGCRNSEIADQLHLAEGTVRNYVSVLMGKLNVRDRTQAVLRARELGLV